MSKEVKAGLMIGAAVVLLIVFVLTGGKLGDLARSPKPDGPVGPDDREKTQAKAGEYLFCFWNVENLFDDVDDHRKSKGDSEFDGWLGGDKEALAQKLKHLADVLMKLNGGRGPDVLGVCEVESERAAQLLADTLNKRLGKEEYHVVFRDVGVGRHISPALLTRLPVVRDRTDTWGKRQRILKTVVRVGGHELMVVVSHWTSRVPSGSGRRLPDHKSGEPENAKGRANYADAIYGEYKAAYLANPKLDFLLCGDFNDNPDDAAVKEHLHATGDLKAVKASTGQTPRLFDLFARAYEQGRSTIDPHGKRAAVFDHVCVSPGMLDDEGWSCEPESAQIVTSFAYKDRPNRFGGKNDKRPFDVRGASDHFPVTVRLRVR